MGEVGNGNIAPVRQNRMCFARAVRSATLRQSLSYLDNCFLLFSLSLYLSLSRAYSPSFREVRPLFVPTSLQLLSPAPRNNCRADGEVARREIITLQLKLHPKDCWSIRAEKYIVCSLQMAAVAAGSNNVGASRSNRMQDTKYERQNL